GRRGFFGADQAGNLVGTARVLGAGGATFRYHLVEMVDVFGHSVLYDYTQETPGGWSLLSKISWVFLGGGAGSRYSVELAYEGRDDILSDAGSGAEIRLNKRLSTVNVYYSGAAGRERVRGWELTYSPDAWLSQLVRVRR